MLCEIFIQTQQRDDVDIPLMLARNVTITNGVINLNYNQVDLASIHGIYDTTAYKIFACSLPSAIYVRLMTSFYAANETDLNIIHFPEFCLCIFLVNKFSSFPIFIINN